MSNKILVATLLRVVSQHRAGEAPREIVELLSKEHRTHQQQVIKLLAEVLAEYSNQPADGRNQDACGFAEDVRILLETSKRTFPYI